MPKPPDVVKITRKIAKNSPEQGSQTEVKQ
jgi:hypothetical protein